MNGVLKTQTSYLTVSKQSVDTGEGTVDPVLTLIEDIQSKLPAIFDVEEVAQKYPILYTDSMNTVLRQELIRYVTHSLCTPFN